MVGNIWSSLGSLTGMKILIVDDEPLARERLIALTKELGAGEIVGEAGDGKQALRLVAGQTPDVLLLDIRMPGMDGLEVARHLADLEDPPAVIFTTAYDQHALNAFEAHAVDYLLKPVRRERLAGALEKARRLTRGALDDLQREDIGKARSHISVTLGGRINLVPVEKVRYFHADQKYVMIGYPDGQMVTEESLKSLEVEFGGRFLRIHRNALIAPCFVEALERGEEGHYLVRLQGVSETFEISRRLLGTVKKRLLTPDS